MESNVEELEKLKRRLTLELSLEEVEPHYRNVMRQLRSTRLNGFRPGKFPKGWLEKRFKSVMHHEAIEYVIPGFIDEALQKNELQQATQAVISKLELDQKQPLKAVIEFEVKPTLELPDYKKFKLTRKEVESVNPEEVEEELKKTQNNLAQVEDLHVFELSEILQSTGHFRMGNSKVSSLDESLRFVRSLSTPVFC